MPPQKIEEIDALRRPLAEAVARWTDGVNQLNTTIPNLMFFRREEPTQPANCMVEPSVALVVQGAKRALLGDNVYDYDIRRFLITSLDLPAMMHIVEASRDKPYLGVMLKLDLHVVAELMMQSGMPPPPEHASDRGMVLGETTPHLLHAFRRLLDLLDEPASIPVLAPLIQREICYRLLMSDQGARLWQIASVGSQSHRIARAIDWLKSHFAHPLRIEELAAHVQMSASSFHHHFRLLTAMSPLQFQKWLRLNEARRLMLADHLDASTAAFQVGYESPSQFSREYSRLFGTPPRRDIDNLRRLSDTGTGMAPLQSAALS
ncbi:MAG: AraC family transcriptional regulator N-terminal domain-containing protein [Bacillota bacterium]